MADGRRAGVRAPAARSWHGVGVHVRPAGRTAFLLEFDDLDAVLASHAALRAAALPGIVELVPAARTILVEVDPAVTRVQDAIAQVRRLRPGPRPTVTGATVELPVTYDGPDLVDAAVALDLDPDGLVRWHTATEWTVAFTGFAPGFAYLVAAGPGGGRDVPRRVSPRTSVPAGSVGLAGPYSGVYPRATPGGWQLIGRTDAAVWDTDRDPPALLAAGARVRFVARDRR